MVKPYGQILNDIREKTSFYRWLEALVDSNAFFTIYSGWTVEQRIEFEARVISEDREAINGLLHRRRNKKELMHEARKHGIKNWSRLSKRELEELLGSN